MVGLRTFQDLRTRISPILIKELKKGRSIFYIVISDCVFDSLQGNPLMFWPERSLGSLGMEPDDFVIVPEDSIKFDL